jgi:large subunit ribosomal protein L23
MNADQIIIEPVVTEKTNMMREEAMKKYAFKVNPAANKLEIMQAVKELFNVKPVACGIIYVKSKSNVARTTGGNRSGNSLLGNLLLVP